MNPTTKRRLVFVAKLAILAAVVGFVSTSLRDGWNRLDDMIDKGQWSLARLRPAWLLAAAALYVVAQLPNAEFWRRVLTALGQRLPRSVVYRAFYIGHLGKYVPGKAVVVVMRSGMLTAHGAQPAAAVVSVFYETLTMMAVGGLLSAVVMAAKYRDHVDWLLAACAMMVVTALPTLPPVFSRVVRKLRIGRSDEASAADEVRHLGIGFLARGWAIVAVGWLLTGLSVAATLRAAGFQPRVGFVDEWIVDVGAAAFSVVAGFLSFIPGGFVVRDVVLLTLLQPAYGDAAALVTAVLVRLVWLVAELSVSVILYRAKRFAEPRARDPVTDRNATAAPDAHP